jgi:hypothetical protein
MKLFLIKLGLFTEAEDIKNIMYETFKENTSSINNKIIKFIKNNLLINKNYFDSIIINSEEEEEENVENENNEEEDNKKKSKKNKQENPKIEEEMRKKILEKKEKELEEIFNKIELKHKEIIKQKPYYIYEPSLTSNTLIKDFEKEFWSMTKLNKCSNCGALSAKFKKMNNLRFFRIMPNERDKKKMEKLGIDLEKGALEHGVSKREKEKNKKKEKKRKRRKRGSNK